MTGRFQAIPTQSDPTESVPHRPFSDVGIDPRFRLPFTSEHAAAAQKIKEEREKTGDFSLPPSTSTAATTVPPQPFPCIDPRTGAADTTAPPQPVDTSAHDSETSAPPQPFPCIDPRTGASNRPEPSAGDAETTVPPQPFPCVGMDPRARTPYADAMEQPQRAARAGDSNGTLEKAAPGKGSTLGDLVLLWVMA